VVKKIFLELVENDQEVSLDLVAIETEGFDQGAGCRGFPERPCLLYGEAQ
jgi:hypothetical protein